MIRARQEEAMNAVADIANAIRDGRPDDALAGLLGREDRAYREIESLVTQLMSGCGHGAVWIPRATARRLRTRETARKPRRATAHS